MQENDFLYKYYAILIDADNVSVKYAKSIFEELSKYGTATVKRIYGNWKNAKLVGWIPMLQELALTPIQQFDNVKTKNATDIALIIDAMDILYTQKVDGFCLISSDSDYTKLATRLRESNKHIIGMGETKTPSPFIASCNKFIYLENLLEEETNNEEASNQLHISKSKMKIDDATIRFIKKAIIESISEDYDGDWAHLSTVGNIIIKQRPDFDPRNYGYAKLNKFFSDSKLKNHFEMNYSDESHTHFIRIKN